VTRRRPVTNNGTQTIHIHGGGHCLANERSQCIRRIRTETAEEEVVTSQHSSGQTNRKPEHLGKERRSNPLSAQRDSSLPNNGRLTDVPNHPAKNVHMGRNSSNFNTLKASGHYMHHLQSAHRVYLCVPYGTPVNSGCFPKQQ
jgi:hypothetical protein